MPSTLRISPESKALRAYYAALRDLAAQEVSHEQAVRSAFQALLADLARPLKWTAIPELGKKVQARGRRTRVVPDGTIRDKYQLPRGYWEAKDTADDLDTEIRDKRSKGYPFTNTIFWTPTRAVLFQDGYQAFDVAIDEANGNPAAFCDILTTFFTYQEKPYSDFEEAVEQFTARVPEVGKKLAEIIAEAHKSNRRFKEVFATFFDLCKTTLNPNISRQAVDEMLVQHLLTARLFKSVFNNPDFLRRNVIAAEVEKVIDALASRAFSRGEFLASLDRFYIAIENAAARVHDWSSKQGFLNSIYERFFQGYCVKTADTHGIVYTPQPIVDFMCASVEWALEHEFGKQLGDDGVNILDPCTGTGNFVVNLIRRAGERGPKHLRRMYNEQLFANEIMLMPYYIAALNVEHEFFEQTGEYEPFEGLCFVDTLELAEPKHTGLFTEANLKRVERQKSTPIEVVIGNPPYNVGQMVHNEQNQNRSYPTVDGWVKHSYAKDSAATSVSKLNDPYVKFFRWATRRLGERDGIICFVSNNAFVENVAFDGMRKHLARDFQAIYHLDLEGNVRENPTMSGTQYNVFGIQVGVGITVCVKRSKSRRRGLFYARVNKSLRRYEKLDWLRQQESADCVKWAKVKPDAKHTWLVPANGIEFAQLPAIASKDARSRTNGASGVIFKDYSLGIATHRDSVVYDFSKETLYNRAKTFVEAYNAEVDRWKRAPKGADLNKFVKYDTIAWDRDLKNDLRRGRYAEVDPELLRDVCYRPFTRHWLCFDRLLNAEIYGFPSIAPTQEAHDENRLIACSDLAFRSEVFSSLLIRGIGDLHLCATLDGHQCFPYYMYDEDGTNRRENITGWALDLFRRHFAAVSPDAAAKAKRITKWDIFHYIYAILHHPGYRKTFADNLKRELPRIPLAKSFDDFRAFMKAGERLAELHLHYDDERVIRPFPLKEVWTLTDDEGRKRPKSWRIEDRMRLDKDKTSLKVNDTLTLTGIPAEVLRYRLGNRSALEWVIDQYQVTTDNRTGIVSDCNTWGEERNDPEYIVRLVKQVVTVSLETMRLVDALPSDYGGAPHPSARSNGEVESPRDDAKGEEKGPHGRAQPSFQLRSDTRDHQRRLR